MPSAPFCLWQMEGCLAPECHHLPMKTAGAADAQGMGTSFKALGRVTPNPQFYTRGN